MALSRWSHSPHYIYEISDREVQICLFGHFSYADVIRRYDIIEKRAKDDGYGFFSRLELRAYLKLWAYWKLKKMSFETYVRYLNYIRNYGHVRDYCWYEDRKFPEFLRYKTYPTRMGKMLDEWYRKEQLKKDR